MSNPFPLDRMNVPTFYTPKNGKNGHHLPSGFVLTESSSHGYPGWISLGYVSKQTPFGQGIYMGFMWTELRAATMAEVLANITRDHPFGRDFRPSSQEAMNLGFGLIMSGAISNWTTDSGKPSILPVSKQKLVDAQQEAILKHTALLARWDEITR